jgi:FtsP/CotA-like multicopper oxidase with cupredoxin domain
MVACFFISERKERCHSVTFSFGLRHPIPEAAQLTKDTVSVPPDERYDIGFIAAETGQWMLHCHILHHTTYDNVGLGGLMMVINVVK